MYSIIYRVVPILLTVGAIGMHFNSCEWNLNVDAKKRISASQSSRIIYYRYRQSSRSGTFMLLAKPSVSKDEAERFGVFFPAILVGAAALVFHTHRD